MSAAATDRALRLFVAGIPRPQGSMRLHQLPNGGTAARYPAAVYQWRAQVQQIAADAMVGVERFTGAVTVGLGFNLPRPAGHFGTGRNARTLRPSAPPWPDKMPDTDKLVRCVLDALTDAGVWHDDGQVVELHAVKRYATEYDRPGVHIGIKEAGP